MIEFKIEYLTKYGMALYIVGGCKELGFWDIEKSIRLECFEFETKTFEYKYFVAQYENPMLDLLWEKGSNRVYSYEKQENYFQVPTQSKSFYTIIGSKEGQNLSSKDTKTVLEKFLQENFSDSIQMSFKKESFCYSIFVDIKEDQEILYYFEVQHRQGIIKNSSMKSFNINSLQENVYKKNKIQLTSFTKVQHVGPKIDQELLNGNIVGCTIVQLLLEEFQVNSNHKTSQKKIKKLNQNVYYGRVPQSNSELDLIKDSESRIVVEFTQINSQPLIYQKNTNKDINYIQINLLKVKQNFTNNYLVGLILIIKSLIQMYQTIYVCTNSTQNLHKYLKAYEKNKSFFSDHTEFQKFSEYVQQLVNSVE